MTKRSQSRALSPTSTAFSGISNYRTESYRPIRDKTVPAVTIDYRLISKTHFDELSKYRTGYLSKVPPKSRSTAKQKLTRLTIQQFHELSTDVYDELVRRNGDTEVPLPAREGFHPERNQARQKLATLPTTKFEKLSRDVYFELARRYPGFKDDSFMPWHRIRLGSKSTSKEAGACRHLLYIVYWVRDMDKQESFLQYLFALSKDLEVVLDMSSTYCPVPQIEETAQARDFFVLLLASQAPSGRGSPRCNYDDYPAPDFPVNSPPRTSTERTSGRVSADRVVDTSYGSGISAHRPSEDRRWPSEDISAGRTMQHDYTSLPNAPKHKRAKPSDDRCRSSEDNFVGRTMHHDYYPLPNAPEHKRAKLSDEHQGDEVTQKDQDQIWGMA
ncbi:hypothetical protein ARMSODRAFT_982630 [Armillaria solidipes]|uniref:GIT Spa2 homology (SHD) domain-containing protein n=1 Tax=Armillaria solidipes TaxID=1076256 RepID=A0A2H3AT93_9AGAR|nr:hypothetical protein ARMSODRAFT_982630 [Armillaria solidipes]